MSRFKPAEMPAVLTESRDQKTRREMEDVAGNVGLPGFIRDLVKDFLVDKREPLSLHLNADNPTVQRLARRQTLHDAVAQNALVALYNNALMLLSRTIAPEDVRAMFQQYNAVIDLMLGLADERVKLGGEAAALRAQVIDLDRKQANAQALPRWVTCFVAMPFKKETEAVYPALKEVLEDAPFLWQVTRADAQTYEANLWENIKAHMVRAHCFVADISDGNLNVYLEVGRMEALGRELLLLKREGTPDLPADLRGHLHVQYGGAGPAMVEALRAEILKRKRFVEQRGEHYLSETVLRRCAGDQVAEAAIRKIAAAYDTCDDFLAADAGEVARRLTLGRGGVEDAQGALKAYLERMPAARR